MIFRTDKNKSLNHRKCNTKVTRWLVIPDLHCPYHDERSLKAVEKLAADYRWDGVLLLGDVMDFDCISTHNIGKLRLVESKRIQQDYRVAAKILDRLIAIVRRENKKARVVYLEGNHEHRLTRFIDANPALEGLIEVPHALDFKKRGIEWVPYWSTGEVFRIGKAAFIHGRYICEHHAKKHTLRYGCNIYYGHVHDTQCYAAELYGRDQTIVGQSLGCLCLPQSYMQGKPDKWQQAVGVFEFLPSGDFGYSVIRINEHKFVYGGKVYEG